MRRRRGNLFLTILPALIITLGLASLSYFLTLNSVEKESIKIERLIGRESGDKHNLRGYILASFIREELLNQGYPTIKNFEDIDMLNLKNKLNLRRDQISIWKEINPKILLFTLTLDEYKCRVYFNDEINLTLRASKCIKNIR